MILAAADCANNNVSPPPELSDYFKCELFGALPHGLGWKYEPCKWVQRVTVFVSVYNAHKTFSDANRSYKGKQLVEWMKANKRILNIVKQIDAMRKENGI